MTNFFFKIETPLPKLCTLKLNSKSNLVNPRYINVFLHFNKTYFCENKLKIYLGNLSFIFGTLSLFLTLN